MNNLSPLEQKLFDYLEKEYIICLQENYENFAPEEQDQIESALLALVAKGILSCNNNCFTLKSKKK